MQNTFTILFILQCLSDSTFANTNDKCIQNPINCPEGFSFSLFYKPEYAETDNELVIEGIDKHEKEYIISNGGDIGTPGFAVYRQGGTLGAVVSTGNLTWTLEVRGQIPTRGKWSNIGVRWKPNPYESKEQKAELIKGV